MNDQTRLELMDYLIANWGDDHPEGLAAAKRQRAEVAARLETQQAAVTEPVAVATEGRPPEVVVQLKTVKIGVKAPVSKKKAQA